MKQSVAIFGRGRIGTAVARLLAQEGYTPTLYDKGEWDATVYDRHDVFLAACPWDATAQIVNELKRRDGKLYFDMTEDVQIGAISRKAGTGNSTFVPHCGVAPGAVSILGAHLMSREACRSLHIRVGAIPLQPTNRLGYSLTWSTEGLVNEYLKPCPAIEHSLPIYLSPLQDVVQVGLFEAFNTSGGAGTLPITMLDKLADLTYKTIRWPGHRNLMLFLLDDLGFRARPQDLVRVLDWSLPRGDADFVTINIQTDHDEYSKHIIGNNIMSAIQRATAAGCAAVMLHMMTRGSIVRDGGWVANEDIPLESVQQWKCWRDVYGEAP